MIKSSDAANAINYHRQDSVVASTSQTLKDWQTVSLKRELDIDLVDCMDKAPSVGLGISLASKDRKVLVLDCDSTIRTDIGCLTTIGETAPENFVHFVFNDKTFHSTEGLPVRGFDRIDIGAMALGAGYEKSYSFSNLEDLLIGMESVMQDTGPIMVVIDVEFDGFAASYPEGDNAESWNRVRETLRR